MSASGRVLSLLESMDRLFEGAVLEPDSWDDSAFADWLENVLGDAESLDPQSIKIVKRTARRAQRLQRYWASHSEGPDDWRMRVDETLGSAGWRPGLELAEVGMAADPDPELFAELAKRFRAVNFQPLALSYEEWMAKESSRQEGGSK